MYMGTIAKSHDGNEIYILNGKSLYLDIWLYDIDLKVSTKTSGFSKGPSIKLLTIRERGRWSFKGT